jgi:DNA-binding CsgD family transcriptional regulator
MIERLTRRELQVLAYVQGNGPVSRAQVAEHFSIAPNTASVHLHNLQLKGRIHSSQVGRYAKWLSGPAAKNQPVAVESFHQLASVWARQAA